MSSSRFFSVFVGLTLAALAVLTVLTVRAGIATSEIVSSQKAALDQHERHPDFINLNAAAVAEQARMEYRRGEWNAGYSPMAAELAEQARLEFRRGEWYAGRSANPAKFDVEQARIQWRAGK